METLKTILSKVAKSEMIKTIAVLFCMFMFTGVAQAAGVDTGASSANSLQAWLKTWIPLFCASVIMLAALGWLVHMIPLNWAGRAGVAMLVMGSASYIVGLFGLS